MNIHTQESYTGTEAAVDFGLGASSGLLPDFFQMSMRWRLLTN